MEWPGHPPLEGGGGVSIILKVHFEIVIQYLI